MGAGQMRRIAIVGSPGAGKSTLVRRLGSALGIPVIHLDALFWRPGWVETPRDEFIERQCRALAGADMDRRRQLWRGDGPAPRRR